MPSQGGRHDGLAGVGAVGIEDLALDVEPCQSRPCQGVGEEVPPGSDVGGGPVLEEVLPDLVVVTATQAPGEGVQAARARQVPLGLESAGDPAARITSRVAARIVILSKAGAAVDEDRLRPVIPSPPQGHPLRGELGQRVVGSRALPQGQQCDRRHGPRILEGGQKGGVLDRPLDEDRGGTHLLQKRRQGQGAGGRVVADGDEVNARLTPAPLGVHGALEPGGDLGRRSAHSHSPWEATRKSLHSALLSARSRTTESR